MTLSNVFPQLFMGLSSLLSSLSEICTIWCTNVVAMQPKGALNSEIPSIPQGIHRQTLFRVHWHLNGPTKQMHTIGSTLMSHEGILGREAMVLCAQVASRLQAPVL